MVQNNPTRRDLIKAALSAMPLVAFDWGALPVARADTGTAGGVDVIVIGSGLGGLSCAAAFARQGFRPLVIEQHDKPGGYATAFARPGGFTFDVSLHSTGAEQRNGVRNLIHGLPEITDVEFVPLPYLYRAMFPDYDFRVEHNNLPGYVAMLQRLFPQEKAGIHGLFGDMGMLWDEIQKLSSAHSQVDMETFGEEYPKLSLCSHQTWGDMVNAHPQIVINPAS